MNNETLITFVKLLVELINSLLWPGVFFFGLFYFRKELKTFIRNISEISFKAGGVEATAKRQIEAAALLGAAEANKTETTTEGAPPPPPLEVKARSIAATVQSAVGHRSANRLSNASVLWVDDRPSNNTYERQALEALGIRFTLSTSTEDALRHLGNKEFDAVISDMGRPGDSNAGLTLLNEIRKLDLSAPVIIYAGAAAVKRRYDIMREGAYGSTNSPQELFQLVTQALKEN